MTNRQQIFGWVVFVILITFSVIEFILNHYPDAIYLVILAHVIRTATTEDD